ncbi:hypothetical protein VMCG_06420 [Cytospora schulzeri]|uniref:Uncharacterized protein n=1 Tax=Cytospora schulzeri TaxID=448051 RepID=A0A423W879_9PEZI|nr:hypothetical protein VMCG_06420 [Valsa malicola]
MPILGATPTQDYNPSPRLPWNYSKITQLFRATSSRTLPEGSSVSEVLFDVEDFEPLHGFLGARDYSDDFHESVPGERIEAMARMAYSWVDGDRSNAARRRRTDSRPTAVRSQSSLNTAVGARTGAGSDEQSNKKDQSIADVLELEVEMDCFDQVGDAELFSEMESTNGR